eukprot:NODE_719_length_2808_cov_12.554644.p1 GENE.NODE_719_length_2808_cov_12.554644~~NODE_719_length_2808_cov_12.554644.p1  ORF type:complete len:771 (-),score=198.34 NODE_719_length_2808_cov_12.554644:339-2651(-)
MAEGLHHTGTSSPEVKAAADEEDASKRHGFRVLRELLEGSGSLLRGWFVHFDRTQQGKCCAADFDAGLRSLQYTGDTIALWEDIDRNHDGEIALEEVSPQVAFFWYSFRRWCGSKFEGVDEMVRKLKGVVEEAGKTPHWSVDDVLREEEFVCGLKCLGWDNGMESELFHALDMQGDCVIRARDLHWIEGQCRRHQKKEAARRRARHLSAIKTQGRMACQSALHKFKCMLRARFSSLFRAWRACLDLDNSMTVQKAEVYKVVRNLNWKGDVRALWRAMDYDGSGVITLEEFDPPSAQLLAHLKEWAEINFGPKPSRAMFAALDVHRARKLRYNEFCNECQARGFCKGAKLLATWLDWQDKKFLQEEDFQVLDIWRPAAWLTAKPNPQAAAEFKAVLLRRHRNFLKAWRQVLDKDNSNRCNWQEFQTAAKQVQFNGDVAGAWLFFDEDLSGTISLKEIDEKAHNALTAFKTWVCEEFGSMRSTFKVLDTDGSHELSYKEFRSACRSYGFCGDLRAIFDCLDQTGDKVLHYKDLVFLDNWDDDAEEQASASTIGDGDDGQLAHGDQHNATKLLEYGTEVPGPGSYEIGGTFGSEVPPNLKSGSSYSFTCRPTPTRWTTKSLGPGRYDPSIMPTIHRKPAWAFGTTPTQRQPPSRARTPGGRLEGNCRLPTPASARSTTPAGESFGKSRASVTPGPGSYNLRSTFEGPRFSMRPRRGLVLHPSQYAGRRDQGVRQNASHCGDPCQGGAARAAATVAVMPPGAARGWNSRFDIID